MYRPLSCSPWRRNAPSCATRPRRWSIRSPASPIAAPSLKRSFRFSKRQEAEGRSAVVVLADLDHFKSINDRFGHAVGDRVLRIFAEAASAKLGPHDLIGRLGGEEFAIVIYDSGRDKGLAIAERIRLAFETAAAEVDGRRGRRHGQHGDSDRRDQPVRHSGALGAGRRGALLREGARDATAPRSLRSSSVLELATRRRLSTQPSGAASMFSAVQASRPGMSCAAQPEASQAIRPSRIYASATCQSGGICYDTA